MLYPKRSKAAYPPPRCVLDFRIKILRKIHQNSFENQPQNQSKITEKWAPQTTQNGPQMGSRKIQRTIHQNQSKINQKSSKHGPPKPPKMSPKWASWGLLGPLGGLMVLGGILEAVLGRLGGVLVANMAPTWPPKRSPNRSNIEAKINQFLNASWDRIFEG